MAISLIWKRSAKIRTRSSVVRKLMCCATRRTMSSGRQRRSESVGVHLLTVRGHARDRIAVVHARVGVQNQRASFVQAQVPQFVRHREASPFEGVRLVDPDDAGSVFAQEHAGDVVVHVCGTTRTPRCSARAKGSTGGASSRNSRSGPRAARSAFATGAPPLRCLRPYRGDIGGMTRGESGRFVQVE